MLNLLNKYLRIPSQAETREKFTQFFFSMPEHRWISQNTNTLNAFHGLLEKLPVSLLTKLTHDSVCFVPSEIFSQNKTQLHSTIVIFPEYRKILQQDASKGTAFLAHELALVLYEIEHEKDIDPLMAEVEADKFVCDLGLADELEDLLLSMDESTDKRLRLTYLTLKSLGIN